MHPILRKLHTISRFRLGNLIFMMWENKVLATVLGVILGTGTMSLAYMGLNTAISNIFHTQSFDLGMYMPDALFNSVNVGANVAVINAIVVSLVFIVLFMALTVKVFKSRDVK